MADTLAFFATGLLVGVLGGLRAAWDLRVG
jgi:hypothetical protein